MNKETVKKMGDMRLYGMQTAFKTFVELPPQVSFTNDEMAQYLVQSEWDERKHRSIDAAYTELIKNVLELKGIKNWYFGLESALKFNNIKH